MRGAFCHQPIRRWNRLPKPPNAQNDRYRTEQNQEQTKAVDRSREQEIKNLVCERSR